MWWLPLLRPEFVFKNVPNRVFQAPVVWGTHERRGSSFIFDDESERFWGTKPLAWDPLSGTQSNRRPRQAACSSQNFDAVYEAQVDFRVADGTSHGGSGRGHRRRGARGVRHRVPSAGRVRGPSPVKTWVFKILVQCGEALLAHPPAQTRRSGCRRSSRRSRPLVADHEHGPAARLERVEAMRVLDRLLAQLDEEKREVFVLARSKQMTAAEIAEIIEANVNTVGSRLRAARQEFEKAPAALSGARTAEAAMNDLGPEARSLLEAARGRMPPPARIARGSSTPWPCAWPPWERRLWLRAVRPP